MAKIEQQIVLSFQTKLDEAKSDILSLAKLYKESMSTPTGTAGAAGQAGGFSAADKASIEQVVAQRATESGLSPEELKAVLADINTVLEQEEGIRKRLTELKEKSFATEEKIKAKEQEKNDLIAKGAQLLGLREGATLKEVAAAKQALDQAVENGTATKEQLALQQQMVGLMGEVSTKNRSLGQLIRHNGELTAEQTALLADQDSAFDNLRVALRKLNLTSEERSDIENKLVNVLIDQTTQTKVLEQAQKKVAAAAKENAKAQAEINSALKNTPKTFAEKATSAFLYFQAVQAIRRVVRAAIRTLTELDRALTDIAIVTNMTRKETQGLIGTYQDMAKRVGLTTTEVVNLSTAFFRQGRAAEDALRLTETAAKFARIAAINVNDAANFLTAAINGFNLAASEANRIIDRFAALGASAAASAQEIAIALSKVAPAAASAGVEIDNLMAFVTKAIETTREAPENIGTAFKTIFARMRELTDIGKVMEDGMDVNRVESALKNIGVDLRDASGEFRNLDQVLIEVGHRWNDISRSQQAYVATTLAGTRQQTRLIALFENFDRTLELITVSQQSAGAAAIQHAEFMQGLEAATTNLKTSFQEFITSIANSDQMLFVIDSLRIGIDLLNTVFGKLILAGLAFKAVTASIASGQSRFAKALLSVWAGVGKLTTAYGANTVATYKNQLANGESRKSALKHALANTKLGKSYVILKGGIIAKTTALKSSTAVMEWQTVSAFRAAKSLSILQAAKLKTAIAAKVMGKAFVAAGAKILAIMAKLLLSPLALLVAIGGIVLALKKMADATDTTNPKVAEWQIRIKKASQALQNIIQRIKDFFTNLRDGDSFASKFFRAFLNGWKSIFKFLGRLPIIGEMFQAFVEDLNATERAAAGFVVLTNHIKDLNKEIRETQKTTQQLSSTLDRFQRLNRQRFRSDREIQEMNELEADLQRRLNTTATGFDLIATAQIQITVNTNEIDRLNQEIHDRIKEWFSNNPTLSFNDLLNSDALTNEMKEHIPAVAHSFASIFIKEFKDLAPEIQAALAQLFQIDPDIVVNQGVEFLAEADTGVKLKDTVQQTDWWATASNAFRTVKGLGGMSVAGASILPGLVSKDVEIEIDFEVKIGEDPEESFQRAVEEAGFKGTFEEFLEATAGVFIPQEATIEVSDIYDGLFETIPTLMKTLSDIDTPESLIDFFDRLNNVSLSNIDPEEFANLQKIFPEFFALRDFSNSPEAIMKLFEQGGISALRNASSVFDRIADRAKSIPALQDVWGFSAEDGKVIIKTADEVQQEWRTALLNALYEGDDFTETLSNLIRDGFEGVTGDEIRSMRIEEMFLDEFDAGGLQRRIFDAVDDINKIIELAQKDISQLTPADMALLNRFPEALAAMRAGTFDALEFESQAREKISQDIADQAQLIADRYRLERNQIADILGVSRELNDEDLQAAFNQAVLAGTITKEAERRWRFAVKQAEEDLGILDTMHDFAMIERGLTEEIRKRYKVQLDLLAAQQNAIKDAEKMRQLQEDSANIARRSIEATRIGAVGSVEARFNQQQINREIEQMNRSLQDRLKTAQLEAQQKILEDSQQKALENVTERLARSTERSGDILERIEPFVETIADELEKQETTTTTTTTARTRGSAGFQRRDELTAYEQLVEVG